MVHDVSSGYIDDRIRGCEIWNTDYTVLTAQILCATSRFCRTVVPALYDYVKREMYFKNLYILVAFELTLAFDNAYWWVCYERAEGRFSGHPLGAIRNASESAY